MTTETMAALRPGLSPSIGDLKTSGATLEIRDVGKAYGDVTAVDRVSIDIPSGAFVTLLGASGSGKTTLLRIIAGFETASSGSILLDGVDISRLPVHRRNIGMVFQNYALFPHMTVEKNVEFPLARHGVPRADRPRLVRDALEAVELVGFEKRKSSQLSGGQQQRVALARAIVSKPRLLLMDEPLGALDRRLREALQVKIRSLSHDLGLTVINVTHDQEEALTMSDRIALLAKGGLQQYGTPAELYSTPSNETVARFLGESNIFDGVPAQTESGWAIQVGDSSVALPSSAEPFEPGVEVALFLRPHRMTVSAPGDSVEEGCEVLHGIVDAVIYAGDACRVRVRLRNDDVIVVRAPAEASVRLSQGDEVKVTWLAEDSLVIP
ncbi:ABC transporter ATP-binding protein [Microbacterium tumbae]